MYAQNSEDVVLARLFKGSTGRYVDVGAGDPTHMSVTKLFYDRGWRGINIEPDPRHFQWYEEARSQDQNHQVACGATSGVATLYLSPDGMLGLSSLLPHERWHETQVRVYPLWMLVRGKIDFLKIDVEGSERAVLEGADLKEMDPRIIVIEATKPCTPEPSFYEWEDLLVKAGYVVVMDDGLNRWYARAADTEAREALAVPETVWQW